METLFLSELQTSGRPVPWLDIIGIFLYIAGFIVGLGAVTVIDIHGALRRKSAYWTEATTRTHKVTKPLIWIGLFLAISGALITYRDTGFSGILLLQAVIAVVLVLNGLFLSFYVSPYMLKREREGRASELLPASLQIKIAISFFVSFTGWWSEVFLLVVRGQGAPRHLSTDHDPLFETHRWTANLRILEINELKTVPHVPLSHPFVQRLIETMRREFLDQVLFWNLGIWSGSSPTSRPTTTRHAATRHWRGTRR